MEEHHHNTIVQMQERASINIEQLKIIASAYPDPTLIIDNQATIQWANQPYLDTFHLDLKQLGRQSLSVIIGFDSPNLLAAIYQQKTYENEYPIYFKQHLCYYEFKLVPIGQTPYNLLMQRDITERKTEENRRREQEGMLESVIFNNDDAVFLLDTELRLTKFNKAFAKRLETYNGISPYPQAYFLDLMPDETLKQRWQQRLQKALEGSHGNFLDKQQVGKKTRFYDIKIYPITLGDEITGVSVFSQDVTKKQNIEQALKDAKERAEDASRAKTQFLSTMSHEIRTPMNAVIGLAHLLLQENPKPEQVENLKTLMFSAENLLVLINDILDFNKVEAGKITLERTDFSLADLLRGIRRSFNPKAQEKGIKLSVSRDDDTPDMLIGDPVRLAQILNNLVSNAIKFTSKGGVNLRVFCQAENQKNVRLRFEVSDTGIGIPPEKYQLIFDAFTQASNDTTRRFGGSGLGLAITKRLLKLFNSEILLDSILGKGTTFAFEVNLPKSNKLHLSETHYYQHDKSSFKNLKGLRILLAEDNEINQMLARKFLQNWGIELDFAENGQIAIDKFKESTTQNAYQLILMDLQMPQVDGYEATRQIRALEGKYAQNIPIIALTADAFSDVKQRVLDTGMNDYISKPFNPNELYNKISRLTKGLSFSDKTSSVQKKAVLSINFQNIVDLAAGDTAYQQELKALYLRFLRDLGQDFAKVMQSHDLVALRALVHKVQPSIKFLELSEIEEIIAKGRQMIEQGNEDQHNERLVIRLQQACQRAINELETY